MPKLLSYHFTEPVGTPKSFAIFSISTRNVTLSWDLPEESKRNGVITAYMVSCSDEDDMLVTTFTTSALTATVKGLGIYSFYTCNVAASTSIGYGPEATLNFTTASDGKERNNSWVTACTPACLLLALGYHCDRPTLHSYVNSRLHYLNSTCSS